MDGKTKTVQKINLKPIAFGVDEQLIFIRRVQCTQRRRGVTQYRHGPNCG